MANSLHENSMYDNNIKVSASIETAMEKTSIQNGNGFSDFVSSGTSLNQEAGMFTLRNSSSSALEELKTSSVQSPGSPNDQNCIPTSITDPQMYKPSKSKIEKIKNWSLSTYKCTKQMISETLGKSSKTVDTELETHIELLRDNQKKYLNILRLARALSSHFYHVIQTQSLLGDSFSELAQKAPELQEEFSYNAETHRCLTKNGETLLSALHFFVSSLNTLCNQTMEDTLLTIKDYESARLEFDAYRNDLEAQKLQLKSDVNSNKLEEAQKNYDVSKTHYDKLRNDVNIKLKFLDENRVKVMHKQLLLFHNAVSAYFSGNQQALDSTMKQFSIKPRTPNSGTPSWLEQ